MSYPVLASTSLKYDLIIVVFHAMFKQTLEKLPAYAGISYRSGESYIYRRRRYTNCNFGADRELYGIYI